MKRTLLVVSTVAVCSLSALDAGAKVTIVNSSTRVLKTAPAQRGPVAANAASRENWVGSKAILRDEKSGKLRKPTADETSQLVKTIKQLASRPSLRTESAERQGSVDNPLAQIIIARATEDGGMETLCVSTFEEAANFLGLVQQPADGGKQ